MSVPAAVRVTQVPRRRWTHLGFVLFLVYVTAFAERTNISVAAPAMRADLGLSANATGLMLSAFFWGYVLTQVPGGWLSKRYGPRIVITVALVMWGVTAILTALATTLPLVITARFLMGLSEGVVWPAFTALFVSWFPSGERARAAGLSLLALPVSAAIMSPTAGWLIESLGWKEMFVIQAMPAFLLAIVAFRVLRNSPEEDPKLSDVEREHIVQTRQKATATDKGQASFIDLLRSPAVWACMVVYFLWLTGFYSFGLWLPTVIKGLSHLGIEAVGWISVIPYGIAGVALMLTARASDRSDLSRSWFVIPPLALAAVALIAQHFLPQTLGLQLFLLVIVAIGVYAPFGPWWAWTYQYVPAEQSAPAAGLVNLGGNFGGLVGPVVVAWAAGTGATREGFWILGASLALACVVAVGLALLGGRTAVKGARTHDQEEVEVG